MNKTEKGFCLSSIAVFAALMFGNHVAIVIAGLVFCVFAYKICRMKDEYWGENEETGYTIYRIRIREI